jgi:hypothetical protein
MAWPKMARAWGSRNAIQARRFLGENILIIVVAGGGRGMLFSRTRSQVLGYQVGGITAQKVIP